MPALRPTPEIQAELDFGPTQQKATDSAAAEGFMRLASPADQPVASPVTAMQTELEASLPRLSEPGGWSVGSVMLGLTAVGAVMWWGIIAGVLALARG